MEELGLNAEDAEPCAQLTLTQTCPTPVPYQAKTWALTKIKISPPCMGECDPDKKVRITYASYLIGLTQVRTGDLQCVRLT